MSTSITLPDEKQAPLATLPDLAVQINAEHRQAEAALNTGLEHARQAGQLLLQAKGLCDHGQWLPWLEQNFDGSARSAQAYMLVADRWPLIEAKAQRVALLSFRDALRLVAEPKDPLKIVVRVCRMLGQALEKATTLGEYNEIRKLALEAQAIAEREVLDSERALGQLLSGPAVGAEPALLTDGDVQIGQFILTPIGIIDTEPTRKPSLDEFRQVVDFVRPVAQHAERMRAKP